ncbi:Oxidoreductase [Mycobacterium basiliense]
MSRMRVGIALDYSGGFHEAVERIVELEKSGVELAMVAEAYAFDAISRLGYWLPRQRASSWLPGWCRSTCARRRCWR